MAERITGKTFGIMLVDEYADYQGCRNCEYQPEPLRMCAWGERRDRVEPICTGWKLRGSVKVSMGWQRVGHDGATFTFLMLHAWLYVTMLHA